ncbi:MAG: 3-hydroxyacyl-CoA dehydrogenase [Betaproteobacteria bacterium]|nr:3-hydroxyacyl-CoA dehydrogenase [Betaproteobacteria bacterium]NDE54083.1 3-hydroxyacyl-CoA dehydrogenase [Actinomycetota bacterium]
MTIIKAGISRSFPQPTHELLARIEGDPSLLIFLGDQAGREYRHWLHSGASAHEDLDLVLIELDLDCLGEHTGEADGLEGSTVLGFARYLLGQEPTPLIELVRQAQTSEQAILKARYFFEALGYKIAVCADRPGRIVDRLIRPYLNAALRRLDDGLASAKDLDATLRMGLGYPDGPIALLNRMGLADHAKRSAKLAEALGDPDFIPARRAQVALVREKDR